MSVEIQKGELDHVEGINNGATPPPVDMLLSELAAQDRTPWYRKPNLRKLYLLFIGSVLCIETTSGYDASVVNGLQAVPKWIECTSGLRVCAEFEADLAADFDAPAGTMLGLIGSMYALGVSRRAH